MKSIREINHKVVVAAVADYLDMQSAAVVWVMPSGNAPLAGEVLK
jgi:hypothetical protein